MSSYFENTPLTSKYGVSTPPPASLRALRGVSPATTPYSDEERSYAMQGVAGNLQNRQRTWEAQERTPFMASHSRSPLDEARMNEILFPSWSAFGSSMAAQPYLAAGRGLKSNVDLMGAGPGSGTGIGRLMGEVGSYGPSGSFSRSQAPTDLDTLAYDARDPFTAPNDQNAALRALMMFMRGR